MKIRITKKKLFISLGALFFILLLFAAAAEITSQSKFCSTCHYMKPFYQSWKTSSHGQVQCSTCHYPPGLRSFFRAKVEGLMQLGRYWTKLYLKSRPWAEIPDESCLRQGCHDKRLLQGRVKFKTVVFDHKIHLEDLKRGKKLRCTSCHSQIVQGEHITVTESTCFICHFKKSEHYPQISQCSHCHVQADLVSDKASRFNHSVVFEKKFSCDKCHSQVIMGDGIVPRENCYKCHFEKERMDKYADTDLIHSTHITAHKIECNQCHLQIQHKIVKDIDTIADCRTCHTGFHQAQKILYTGEGGKGIAHAQPNVMLEKGLSCKGCHMFHEETSGKLVKSETSISREQACESCHGSGFARVLRYWQVSTEKRLGQIKRVYQRSSQEVGGSKSLQREKAGQLLVNAAFNIDVVERGKSVHNMTYSQELLQAAFAYMEEALELVGSPYKPERFLPSAKDIPSQCSQCHAGIEEINGKIYGLSFPHKTHVVGQKIDCSTCHSNAKRHGEFIGSKKQCAACHHQDVKKDCASCHPLQKTLYEGGTLDGQEVPKDMMAEAKAACPDCHRQEKGQISRPDASVCANCHEESYKKTFEEWQASFKKHRDSLRAGLALKKKLRLAKEDSAKLAEVEQTLAKLEDDGSSSVHNSQFIEDLLTRLEQQVKSIQEKQEHE
jgi:nitrate/TMAO reductase-like tetraheme cytochrome c subunit